MNIALWVTQGLLAAAFLAAGTPKLTKARQDLLERMAWVEDFSDVSVKSIGAVEILGALGLVLPGITGIAPILTALAATGLAVDQLVAAGLHIRRGEQQTIVINLVLTAIAVFIAWGRFGPYPL